jgi:undecaprenyl-diphosphatase
MSTSDRPPASQLLIWDAKASERIAQQGEKRWLRWLALGLAHSGDSPLWLVLGMVLFVWGQVVVRPAGARIVIATLVGGTVATLLKWAFRRERPGGSFAGLYARLDRHAFPSGHATRAGCVAASLLPLLPAWAAVALALWAVSVCLARVALRVHYLLDVAVGLLVGLLLGLGVHLAA